MADTNDLPALEDGQTLTKSDGVYKPSAFDVRKYSYWAHIYDDDNNVIGSAIVDGSTIVDFQTGSSKSNLGPRVNIRRTNAAGDVVLDPEYFYDTYTKTKLFKKPSLVEEPHHLDALDAYDDWVVEFALTEVADLSGMALGDDAVNLNSSTESMAFNGLPLKFMHSTEGGIGFYLNEHLEVGLYNAPINVSVEQTRVERMGWVTLKPPAFMIAAKQSAANLQCVDAKWRSNGAVAVFYALYRNYQSADDNVAISVLITNSGRLDVVVSDVSSPDTKLQFFTMNENRSAKSANIEHGGFSLPVDIGDVLHLSNVLLAPPTIEPLTFDVT